MSENDVTDFRLKHVEETCAKHDLAYDKIATKMTDVEKYNIRQEGSQKELTTAVGALATNLTAVTDIVNEIKDRPLQTYTKLKNAIIAGTVTLAFFALTNLLMFYFSMVAKGLIK